MEEAKMDAEITNVTAVVAEETKAPEIGGGDGDKPPEKEQKVAEEELAAGASSNKRPRLAEDNVETPEAAAEPEAEPEPVPPTPPPASTTPDVTVAAVAQVAGPASSKPAAAGRPPPTPTPPPPGPTTAVSVRQYLDQTVVPVLLMALTALAKERPPDPIQYIADFMVQHKDKFTMKEPPAPPDEK